MIVNNFHGTNWRDVVKYPMFVVYKNPSDFPGKFVVRLFNMDKPVHMAAVKDTLEEARAAIQQGPPFMFHNVGRSPQDDPVIVETWI